MKNKNKFKSYSFWMSVCASVVLVINNLAKAFGFNFQSDVFTATVDSVCGVLVVLGILTMSKKDKTAKSDQEITAEQKSSKNSKKDQPENLSQTTKSRKSNTKKENIDNKTEQTK